ncbi:MAG: hypothetical protein U0992_14090 [Planctomycetaceae bacterium]
MNTRPDLESPDERLARRSGLALLLVAIVAPMAWALGYSLLYSLGGIGLLSDGWTLKHWHSALASGNLAAAAGLSLAVAAVTTSLASCGALTVTLLGAAWTPLAMADPCSACRWRLRPPSPRCWAIRY